MATDRNKSADKKSASLAKKLSKVSAQAKSLGINTSKADSMVAQTKREGSKSYKGSKEEKAFLAENIGTESPVIPQKPAIPNTGDMLGMNNASVLQEGLTLQGGQFVKDPNASDVMNATKEANANIGNIANQMIGYLNPEDNQMKNAYEETYGISEREAQRDLRRAERDKQRYTTELNAITTSRDASILALEDTGRGQTTGFIGGEQGRIQRQAAIAALPVQAQLAAAQGDLEIAKSHVDSLFQMKVKDIETEQAYKNTVANTWMSVANTQQSNLLNAAIADSNARAEAKKTAMNDAKQIAMQAIEYGQSSLAASVMKLDPTSATYQQDVMNAMGGLRKPVAAVATKAPEIQNFGTSDAPVWKQYDFSTGTWSDIDGLNNPNVNAVAEKEARADEIATKITNIGNLKTHSGLNSAVGAVGLGRVGIVDAFGAKDEFIGKVEQLISQEFLDKLIDTKGKGATFGALTKPEQDALTAAATAIGFWRVTDDSGKVVGYDIDETSFKEELGTLITLAQKAESQERGYDVTKVPTVDSLFINDLSRSYQSSLMTQDVSNFYK